MQQNEAVCDVLDTGHINPAGNQQTVVITAPEGKLIAEYCVKAGSSQQGDGPEYTPVEPPEASVEISHSSDKDISHYSVRYVDAAPGSVTVMKHVTGTAAEQWWEFEIALTSADADAMARTVTRDDPVASWSDLAPGTYTLSEPTLPDGWSTDAITCSASDADAGMPGFQIEVVSGSAIECSLTNTAAPGEIALTKSVTGVAADYPWSFSFELHTSQGVDTQQVTAGDPVATWSGLVVGDVVTVTEALDDGAWTAGDITCDVEDADPAPGYQIVVSPGAMIDCHAVNDAAPGSVTVVKSAVGGDGSFDFALQPLDGEGAPTGAASIGTATTSEGTGQTMFGPLLGGSMFSLSEVAPGDDWIVGELECAVDGTALDPGGFIVHPGDEISCEIENVKRTKTVVVEPRDEEPDEPGVVVPEPSAEPKPAMEPSPSPSTASGLAVTGGGAAPFAAMTALGMLLAGAALLGRRRDTRRGGDEI